MMLKEKSNNWTRLKLLLLAPAGLLALQAFAHPELVVKPLETLNANTLPAAFGKSTTILQNDQKKKAEYHMVDKQRMTNEEYEEFVKNKVVRSSIHIEKLTNPAGKIVKATSYWNDGKGGNIPSQPIYHELKKGVKLNPADTIDAVGNKQPQTKATTNTPPPPPKMEEVTIVKFREGTTNTPPPPPPVSLGDVDVYYKDTAKPKRFSINPSSTEEDLLKKVNEAYKGNIVKVVTTIYDKKAKEKYIDVITLADKILKDKINYQVEYSYKFRVE